MLIPLHLRDLNLDPQLHPRGQAHLSAASGLVRVPGLLRARLYVVADDEHHLGSWTEGTATPVQLHRLFEGDLPRDKGERKKTKPDLESLVFLPAFAGNPFGALLALGSGSTPRRCLAVCLSLDGKGDVMERSCQIDLKPLYAELGRPVPGQPRSLLGALNIEGCFINEGLFHFLQRGNAGGSPNAVVSFEQVALLSWLLGNTPEVPKRLSVQVLDLGQVVGVPLTLTDGAALTGTGWAGCWAFSAVAENTDNPYADGACVGSAVGVIGPDGTVKQLHHLQGAPKVEGIAARQVGQQLTLDMVTDADEPLQASQLLRVSFALT